MLVAKRTASHNWVEQTKPYEDYNHKKLNISSNARGPFSVPGAGNHGQHQDSRTQGQRRITGAVDVIERCPQWHQWFWAPHVHNCFTFDSERPWS